MEHSAAGLLWGPGSGKTSVALAAFKFLKARKLARKMLVTTVLRAVNLTWPDELAKWSDFHGLKMRLLHGDTFEDELNQDADIYVTNYESLERLVQAIVKKSPKTGRVSVTADPHRIKLLFQSIGLDVLCADELSKLKHPNTTRHQTIKTILAQFKRRWGLTGSPAPNSLMDLFGQAFVLDLGKTFSPYITHFRNQYFDADPYKHTWNLREGADDRIFKQAAPLFHRADIGTRPALVDNNIMVELPSAVRKVYDLVESKFFAELEDGTVTAVNAGAKSTKLRQIANGGVYLDPDMLELVKRGPSDREFINLHTAKVDALADLVDELQGQPLLVAYDFEHDLNRLQKKLGKEVPYIGGGTSLKRSAELVNKWNAGKLPVLLGHPQAMGHALNLQEVPADICWHSLTHNFEHYEQFIRRVNRRGNTAKTTTNHHLLAEDTVDLPILHSLHRKESRQQAFFDAVLEYQKLRRY